MSDSQANNFGKFIPGFEFLQNLAKSTTDAVPHMPNMANWIAPTLSEEEIDKRINELKTVQFWLDQNAKALAATVQALEVQKMTLATLKGMNLNLSEMANSFMPKAAAAPAPAASATGFQWPPERTAAPAQPAAPAAEKAPEAAAPTAPAASLAGLVDPMQMWGALTQQFQTIAASAMAEAGKVGAMAEAGQANAMDVGKNMLKSATQGAADVAASVTAKKQPAAAKKAAATPVAAKAPAKKAPVKKAAAAPKAPRR